LTPPGTGFRIPQNYESICVVGKPAAGDFNPHSAFRIPPFARSHR